jgi:hypothetical protein
MDEKDTRKKSPAGEELSPEELETVTGALYTLPTGGATGGTTHTVDGGAGGSGGGGGGLADTACKDTTDTGILGCPS